MEMIPFSTLTTMINPTDELIVLGEEAMGVLIRTPLGEEILMARDRLVNYARVGNKLIPKDNVEWL